MAGISIKPRAHNSPGGARTSKTWAQTAPVLAARPWWRPPAAGKRCESCAPPVHDDVFGVRGSTVDCLVTVRAGASGDALAAGEPPYLLLVDDTDLFEEVVADVAANRVARVIELDLKVLAESRRVVVAKRLGVAKGLQQRVRLEDLLLDLDDASRLAAHGRHVLHDLFGGLRLSGAALAADDHTVVVPEALPVGSRRSRKRGPVRQTPFFFRPGVTHTHTSAGSWCGAHSPRPRRRAAHSRRGGGHGTASA